jgi:hypothetical protein
MVFNGTNQRIFVPDNANFKLTNSLTIEAYIYVQPLISGNSDGNIVFRGDNSAGFDPFKLAVGLGGNPASVLGFAITDPSNNNVTVSTTIPLNQWIAVAGTLDGSTGQMDLYVNGVLANSTVTSLRPIGDLGGSEPGVGIGALQSAAGFLGPEYFHGMIDEVRISDTALSPSQLLSAPEPGSLVLLAAGLSVLTFRRRKAAQSGSR